MESIKQTLGKFKKVIIGALVLVAVIMVYSLFFKNNLNNEDGGFIRSENQSIVSSELGREIVSTLNRLKGINIDPEFFQDSRFAQLIDFSVELQPQPVGKLNPFREVNPFDVIEDDETVEGAEIIGTATEEFVSEDGQGEVVNP